MARTSLIDLFRHTYRICRLSTIHQIPVNEVQEIWIDRLSRRQVLGGLAIAATSIIPQNRQFPLAQGTSLSPASQPSQDPATKVLVVGAGIAGLTVAYRLHQAGIPVDVVEASPRVGGRLRSMAQVARHPGVVELGGEFIDSRHTAVRSLATELGMELGDLRAADVGLEPEILYFQGQKINHSWVAVEFAPLAQQIAQDVTQLRPWQLTYQDVNPVAARLDRLSLAAYLAQTPMHPIIEALIRVAYVTEYGRDIEEQSCLNLLFLIGAEAGQWSAYGISDERYHLVGGNDGLPRRLADRLNQQIEPSTALESIRTTGSGRYRVSLRRGSTSQERVYDQIVLTLPFTVLRHIELAVEMPPLKRQAIDQLGYGTSTKLAIPVRERIWRTRYGSTINIYTDMDFQNAWESARYSPGPESWLTDLRGGQAGIALGQGSPQFHAIALMSDLESLFPGINQVERGEAVRAAWATDPYAQGSYSCYLPNQWTTFGGAERERIGHIWFAGEHCSIGSQGYMNGACETAEQVARAILQELGIERQMA